MFGFETSRSHDDLIAEVTEIAYQSLLKQGLKRSFVEVELELWQQIRSAFQRPTARPQLLEVA